MTLFGPQILGTLEARGSNFLLIAWQSNEETREKLKNLLIIIIRENAQSTKRDKTRGQLRAVIIIEGASQQAMLHYGSHCFISGIATLDSMLGHFPGVLGNALN